MRRRIREPWLRRGDHFVAASWDEALDTVCAALDRARRDDAASVLEQLRQAVLQEAVEGKLTADWRIFLERGCVYAAQTADGRIVATTAMTTGVAVSIFPKVVGGRSALSSCGIVTFIAARFRMPGPLHRGPRCARRLE